MTTRTLERRSPREVPQLEVDPRIAARRRSVRSDRVRRRLRVVGVLAVIALGITAMWLLSRTALLDVDAIGVVGAGRITDEEVVAASGVSIGQPLLTVDPGGVARRLEQQPWIRSATVERSWGGDLAITIVERVPVARTSGEEGVGELVDVTGANLGPATDQDQSLPEIVGITDGSLELASLLPPGVLSRVTTVSADDEGRLRLQLRPRGVVEFGPATALVEKVAALVTVMGQVDQRDLCTIRVITPDTPVVTRTPICG